MGAPGVAFLGLNIQDLRGDARAFAQEFGITHPSVRTRAAAWPTATARRAFPRPSSWTRAAAWSAT